MNDKPKITTHTVKSGLDPRAVARLKKRHEAELAALTPEARALVDAISAEETRRLLFGDDS